MATAFQLPPRDHNNPPLEEIIILDFDRNLREYDFDLLARIAEIEGKALALGPCTSAEAAGRYGDAVKTILTTIKVIDDEREKLNRPILTAQRALMGRANVYKERLTIAEARIRLHLNTFTASEKKRLADEAAERQRVADVANALAAKVAEDERKALQAIADASAARERARLQDIEDTRAAAEAREAKPVEVIAQVIEAPIAPVYVAAPAPVYAPTRSDRGVLVTDVETWHVEVLNIRQVPDIFLKNPAVLEALRKVIAPSVRGKSGMREIKGCRIYSDTKAAVR